MQIVPEKLAAQHPGKNHFFRAMTAWQLGRRVEAREYYDRGVAWAREYKPRSMKLMLLRNEASQLLGLDDMPEIDWRAHLNRVWYGEEELISLYE